MGQLEELALTQTQVTGAVLEILGRLPHLRYLEISDTRAGPTDFKPGMGFEALQVISFSTARRLRAEDLRTLARYPRLHSILINGVMLGPDRVNELRRGRQSWGWPLWVAQAEAAEDSDTRVDRALEVASAAGQETPHPFEGFHGLVRIHEAESALDEVRAAPSNPSADTFQENEKNFLGEFTVNAVSTKKKTAPRLKRSQSDE